MAGELKLEAGKLVGHPTMMVKPGTLTLEESPGDFSQLDGPSQVRVIKLCDRISYVFDLFTEYDDFANWRKWATRRIVSLRTI